MTSSVLPPPAARGGMSTVYRHRDAATGRDVALKLVHDDVEPGRFEREVQVLAELDDPAIVRYVGHGFADDGRPYLTMEWLEGETLAARLARGALSLEETVALARRVLGALEAAHAAGIVHRDLKPSNLFLVDGRVELAKLIDFGVARVLDGRARTLTRTGVALGTPAYMSPEQVRGSRLIDARADLFALGAVLYECLAGWPAFGGADDMEVMGKVLLEEPPTLPLVPPPALARILSSLLRKDASARPASAAQVLALLDGVAIEPSPQGSAPWFAARAEAAAERAGRCDHDGLLAVLSEAGTRALDEPARRAQLRCLADGAMALFDLGLGELGDALGARTVGLAGGLRLPDDESAALAAMVRGGQAGWRGELAAAFEEGARAARGFQAAGDEGRYLRQRAVIADLAADNGDLPRARVDADAVLCATAAPVAAVARARLALGKVAFAGQNLADARLSWKRVPEDAPPWIRGRALIFLARAALRGGHTAIAENEARAAVGLLGKLPAVKVAAHAALGLALVRSKRPGEALAASRAALAERAAADLAAFVSIATAEVLAAMAGAA